MEVVLGWTRVCLWDNDRSRGEKIRSKNTVNLVRPSTEMSTQSKCLLEINRWAVKANKSEWSLMWRRRSWRTRKTRQRGSKKSARSQGKICGNKSVRKIPYLFSVQDTTHMRRRRECDTGGRGRLSAFKRNLKVVGRLLIKRIKMIPTFWSSFCY